MQRLTLQQANFIAKKYFALLIQKYLECGFCFEVIRKENLDGEQFFMKFSDGTENKFYEIRLIK